MKKKLSLVLVASMLLTMAPAFAVNAAEGEWTWDGDYKTINDAQEYVQFVGEINAGTYTDNGDHKVAADLDFTGIDGNDVVIKNVYQDLKIDYQGHVLSNINRTVTVNADYETNKAYSVGVGLIADESAMWSELLNVKLANCLLDVTVESGRWAHIGGVVGYANRGYANGVDMKNVTIKVAGSGSVGAVYGAQGYNASRGPSMSVTLDNVLINAPKADRVGIVAGQIDGSATDQTAVRIDTMSVANTTFKSVKTVATDTYVGNPTNASVTVADGLTPNVALVDNATGYCANGHTKPEGAVCDEDTACVICAATIAATEHGEAVSTEAEGPYVDAEGKTAGSTCSVCGDVIAESETIPAQTKYEAEDATLGGDAKIQISDGVSGGMYVNDVGGNTGSLDNYIEFVVNAKNAGNYDLSIYYCSGQDRQLEVSVNGAEATVVATPATSTGAWSSDAEATEAITIALEAGENTIRLFNSTWWAPNTDYIELTAAVDDGGDDGDDDEPIDDGFATISTPAEFVEFMDAVSEETFMPTGTIKVTADLDMSGYFYNPMAYMPNFTLDFDGHTISNLIVYQSGDFSHAGLIANFTANGATIKGLKLDTCLLIAETPNVGIVLGKGDRASVTDVEMKNVTVYAPFATSVGGVIGEKAYSCNNNNMSLVMDNVLIDAPNAQNLGLLAGRLTGETEWGAASINVNSVKATNVMLLNNDLPLDLVGEIACVTNEGENPDDYLIVADGVEVSVTAGETTGYCVDGHFERGYDDVYVDADGSANQIWCLICGLPLDIGEAVGPQTKYEAEDAWWLYGTIVDNAEASGGQHVGDIGGPDEGEVDFLVQAVEGGKYTLKIYYIQDAERSITLYVNEMDPMVIQLASGGSWTTPVTVPYEIEVELEEGSNLIWITGPGEGEYGPNIDYIEFEAVVDDGDDGENVPGDDDGENVPGDDDGENVPGDDDGENVPGDDDGENVPGDDDDKKDDASTDDDKKDDASTDDGKKDDAATDDGKKDDGKKDDTSSTDKKEENKPAQTGDATMFAVVAAVVALLGAAVVIKKRHTAE